MRLIVAFLLSCLAASALAQAKVDCGVEKDPLACFTTQSRVAYIDCRLQVELNVAKKQDLVGATACVNDLKRQMEPFYQKAIARVKKTGLASIVKDYYAFWQASMAVIPPRSGETERVWRARLDERADALVERSNRIALER